MGAVDRFLEKYVRFAWLATAYLGLAAISTISKSSFSLLGSYVFVIGVLNLVGTYGLFKKKRWGWKVVAYAAILSLIYLVSFLVVIGVIFNGLILYAVTKFKTQVGGHENDSLVPKQLQKYLP